MTDTQTSVPTSATADRDAKQYEVLCRCGKGWNGLKTCHCAACHRTFSTVIAFDKHRRGTYEPDTRHCVNPTDAGLVRVARDYECWGRA